MPWWPLYLMEQYYTEAFRNYDQRGDGSYHHPQTEIPARHKSMQAYNQDAGVLAKSQVRASILQKTAQRGCCIHIFINFLFCTMDQPTKIFPQIETEMLHTFYCFFVLSLPSVQRSLYCFHIAQGCISIFLFTVYNLFICSFFLVESSISSYSVL